jgi:hypothetical protein
MEETTWWPRLGWKDNIQGTSNLVIFLKAYRKNKTNCTNLLTVFPTYSSIIIPSGRPGFMLNLCGAFAIDHASLLRQPSKSSDLN